MVESMQLDILKAIVLNVAQRAGYQDADVADGIIEAFKEMTGLKEFESTIEVGNK